MGPPAKVKLADVVPGDELTGVVRSIKPYGAFVDVGAESDGLVHISEMSNKFVRDIYSVVSVDDSVSVRVLTVDEAGKRLSLSMKSKPFEANPGDKITGKIVNIVDFGAFVNLSPGTDGLVHRSEVTSDPYADWESFCEVARRWRSPSWRWTRSPTALASACATIATRTGRKCRRRKTTTSERASFCARCTGRAARNVN